MTKVLGIQREHHRWERRVPLTPAHCALLINRGIKVIIQPSHIRSFTNSDYSKVGVVINEDLSEADTILAVKEVNEEDLLQNKTYLFFSHTIKAQPYNMSMLDAILQKNIRLIDYERIVNDKNQRIVRFGKWAGYAGTIDFIHSLGYRLLALGYSSPFLHVAYAHMYPTLGSAKEFIYKMAIKLKEEGLPQPLCPMIFTLTGGNGACCEGVLEILKLLPHEMVSVDDLPKAVDRTDNDKIFICWTSSSDYIEPNDPTKKFDKADFYANPHHYHSVFANKIGRYTSALINNVYWDENLPRILSTKEFREMTETNNSRLLGIADISCDIGGGIEFMSKATTIDNPIFVYDIESESVSDRIDAPGVIILSVDNLPTEFPREASVYFGDSLVPFITEVVNSDIEKDLAETDLPKQVQHAVITHKGKLTPDYSYIADLRAKYQSKVHKYLVLGAGFVTPALVSCLVAQPKNRVTVASLFLKDAQQLGKNRPAVRAVSLDIVNQPQRLDDLVPAHDAVISVLPKMFHLPVAKACIKHKRPLVTASYISPEMRELDDEAKKAGVTILNEIGLDPGIDHMTARKFIAQIRNEGGEIEQFRSVCGGLPAPEFANNPLKYKFSWNPKGVLTAGRADAKYVENGEVVEIDGKKLFTTAKGRQVWPCFDMEVLPNRDSTHYQELYGLSSAKTFKRGTLRYKGYSDVMWAFAELGLFSEDQCDYLERDAPQITWPQFIRKLIKVEDTVQGNDLLSTISKILFTEDSHIKADSTRARDILLAFKWFGMINEEKSVKKSLTPLDTLCELLMASLVLKGGEHDMVLLEHTFHIYWPKTDSREELKSTLIAFGAVGETAMSKTVGVPVAVAAQCIVQGDVTRKGVISPVHSDVYLPILEQLNDKGINFVESRVKIE